MATAARRSGGTAGVSALVFDEVNGRWLAVSAGRGTCSGAPAELWEVFTLQPRPDGTLAGGYSSTTSNSCAYKRTVTFTRTADVDVAGLPDPASQPPRVVSPAEELHGRYHKTTTYRGATPSEEDEAVITDCLRTGDRCMSYLHSPVLVYPMLSGSGKWTVDSGWSEKPCPAGGTTRGKVTAEFPLPTPPQDPITLLIGQGHQQTMGGPCTGSHRPSHGTRTPRHPRPTGDPATLRHRPTKRRHHRDAGPESSNRGHS